jgi:hypothetical protein
MDTPHRKRSAFRAWAASLPLALGLPAAVWLLFLLISVSSRSATSTASDLINSGMLVVLTMIVHLLGYFLTGLPLFLFFHENPRSWTWTPFPGLTIGIFAGSMTVFTTFGGWDQPTIAPHSLSIGAGYGIATAIAALRQRPILD